MFTLNFPTFDHGLQFHLSGYLSLLLAIAKEPGRIEGKIYTKARKKFWGKHQGFSCRYSFKYQCMAATKLDHGQAEARGPWHGPLLRISTGIRVVDEIFPPRKKGWDIISQKNGFRPVENGQQRIGFYDFSIFQPARNVGCWHDLTDFFPNKLWPLWPWPKNVDFGAHNGAAWQRSGDFLAENIGIPTLV